MSKKELLGLPLKIKEKLIPPIGQELKLRSPDGTVINFTVTNRNPSQLRVSLTISDVVDKKQIITGEDAEFRKIMGNITGIRKN